MRERRLGKVTINAELLKNWIIQNSAIKGNFKVIKGIPEDAVYISNHFNEQTGQTSLVYYHESFPIVWPGAYIPEIDVVIEEMQDG